MDITTREWPNVPFGWLLLSGSIKNSTVSLSWEEQSPLSLSRAFDTLQKSVLETHYKTGEEEEKQKKRYCLCSNVLACKNRARVHGRIEQRHYRHITIFLLCSGPSACLYVCLSQGCFCNLNFVLFIALFPSETAFLVRSFPKQKVTNVLGWD